MRVLVLGAAGMLGHRLVQRLSSRLAVAGTLRAESTPQVKAALPRTKLYPHVSAENLSSIERAMDDWRAEIVVNCLGIVKQAAEASQSIPAISVNALLPHQLHRLTQKRGARLIHFSTDCVFSGDRGNYTEDDAPDPVDLYGRSKLLGEVSGPGALTLRTSIIGPEFAHKRGLLEWLLSQRGGRVQGFAAALFSGLTTDVMADLVSNLIETHRDLEGLWHVSSDSITKLDLLRLINDIYGLGIQIEPDATLACDRRLDSTRFRKAVGWQPPRWEAMIEMMHATQEMAADDVR